MRNKVQPVTNLLEYLAATDAPIFAPLGEKVAQGPVRKLVTPIFKRKSFRVKKVPAGAIEKPANPAKVDISPAASRARVEQKADTLLGEINKKKQAIGTAKTQTDMGLGLRRKNPKVGFRPNQSNVTSQINVGAKTTLGTAPARSASQEASALKARVDRKLAPGYQPEVIKKTPVPSPPSQVVKEPTKVANPKKKNKKITILGKKFKRSTVEQYAPAAVAGSAAVGGMGGLFAGSSSD